MLALVFFSALTVIITKALVVAIFTLVIILFAHVYEISPKNIKLVSMRQFAESNDFLFSPKGYYNNEIGTLFKNAKIIEAKEKRAFNTITGNFNGRTWRLFNFSYRVYDNNFNSGYSAHIKKQDMMVNHTVFDLEFNADLPRLYLDAQKNNKKMVDGLSRLTLEANEFNSAFNLYITPGEQVAALQIFTPDLMQELLDMPIKFDIEFIKHQIYIYAFGIVRAEGRLEGMLKLAQHLMDNVAKEIERMKKNQN